MSNTHNVTSYERDLLKMLDDFSSAISQSSGKVSKREIQVLPQSTITRTAWLSMVEITFEDDKIIIIKEYWEPQKGLDWESTLSSSSYHYGEYGEEYQISRSRAKLKGVIVRLDPHRHPLTRRSQERHIHINDEKVIYYEDDLKKGSLARIGPKEFIKAVLKIRKGKTVEEAFKIKV